MVSLVLHYFRHQPPEILHLFMPFFVPILQLHSLRSCHIEDSFHAQAVLLAQFFFKSGFKDYGVDEDLKISDHPLCNTGLISCIVEAAWDNKEALIDTSLRSGEPKCYLIC